MWAAILEASLFVVPVTLGVLYGVAFVAAGLSGGTAVPGEAGARGPTSTVVSLVLGGGVVLLTGVVLLLAVLVPLALFFDASELNDLDLEWEPEPVLYAVLGFFLSGLVTLHYLWKRHEYVVEPDTWEGWWTVVAGYLVVGAVAIALSAVVPMAGVSVGGVAVLLFGLTPVALYKDAAYVRSTDSDWRPNPVNYYLGAVFGTFLFFLVVPLSIYYLFRRNRHVGTI